MNNRTKPANCTCQYPDLIARNMHGHGNDPQGNPCPVGVAWEEEHLRPAQENLRETIFWVAELMHSGTGHALGGQYWNGHTRPVLEPVTTTNIHEAVQFRDAASCQALIDRLDQCKAGVLKPTEHAWMGS